MEHDRKALYYINHWMYFLPSVVHFLSAGQFTEATVLSAGGLAVVEKFAPRVKSLGVDLRFATEVSQQVQGETPDEIIAAIAEHWDAYFEVNDIDVFECEIYLSFDMYPALAIYLISKGKRFIVLESGSNMVPGVAASAAKWWDPAISPAYVRLLNDLPLRGMSARHCDIVTRPNFLRQDGTGVVGVFDLIETMSALPPEQKKRLFEIFGITPEVIESAETAAVFLPHSRGLFRCGSVKYRWIKAPDMDLRWQLIIDCLCLNRVPRVVIKHHPGNGGYEKYFADSIDKDIPTELIRLAVKQIPHLFSVAVSEKADTSNGLKAFDGENSRRTLFPVGIYAITDAFLQLAPVVTAAASNPEIKSLSFHDNILNRQVKDPPVIIQALQAFVDFVLPEGFAAPKVLDSFVGGEGVVNIIDGNVATNWVAGSAPEHLPFLSPIIHQALKNSATVLLNHNPAWWNSSPLNNPFCNPLGFLVTIGKTKVKRDILIDLADEHMLVYSKDKELREKLTAAIDGLTKELKTTGITLKCACTGLAEHNRANAENAFNKEILKNITRKSIDWSSGNNDNSTAALAYRASVFFHEIRRISSGNPNLHIAVLSPILVSGKNTEFEKFIREWPTVEARIKAFLGQLRNESDKTMIEKAKDALFRKYGYDDDFIDEVMRVRPGIKCGNDGVWMGRDIQSRFTNVVGGRRVTADQPAKATNSVYMFGDSVTAGMYVDDGTTIASFLQKYFNQNKFAVNVENCYNTTAYHSDKIFPLMDKTEFKDGDVVVIQANSALFTREICNHAANPPHDIGFKFISTQHRFVRPEFSDEILTDGIHPNSLGNKIIAEEIFRAVTAEGWLRTEQNRTEQNSSLARFLETLSEFKKKSGAIVMNANPFTLGHRHLTEYACGRVNELFVFVVQEDKSFFSFSDRLELVKRGVSDLPNVTVIPSGDFIISSRTFEMYFEKEECQDEAIDASVDVGIFARHVAPALGISVRFSGEEPFDAVTRQYNETMARILPQHGIKFELIPRKEIDGEVVSASRVRKLLETGDFDGIAKIVPETTLSYLQERFAF